MENVRFGLEKMTISLTDEILEDYNIEIKLNDNKRKLLATLIYISGIDKNRDGYVFADNKWLMNVCGFGSEHTVINNVKYLSTVGLIETIRGRRSESSLYKICSEKCSIKVQPNEKSAVIKCSNNVESAVINEKSAVINTKKCSNNPKSAVINLEKCSTDIEIDKDQDKTLRNNKTLRNTGKLDTTSCKEQIEDIDNLNNNETLKIEIMNKQIEELRSMVLALQDTVNKLTDSNKELKETIEKIRTCFKEDRKRLKNLEHITSTNQCNIPGIEDNGNNVTDTNVNGSTTVKTNNNTIPSTNVNENVTKCFNVLGNKTSSLSSKAKAVEMLQDYVNQGILTDGQTRAANKFINNYNQRTGKTTRNTSNVTVTNEEPKLEITEDVHNLFKNFAGLINPVIQDKTITKEQAIECIGYAKEILKIKDLYNITGNYKRYLNYITNPYDYEMGKVYKFAEAA